MSVWTKNIQRRSIEGQTHFGIPRGAKLLDETGIPRLFLFKFRHYLRAWTITSGNKLFILHIKQPIEKHRGPAPDEKFQCVERITNYAGTCQIAVRCKSLLGAQ